MVESFLNNNYTQEKIPINHDLDILAIVSASKSNLSISDISDSSNHPTHFNSSYVYEEINSDDSDDSTVLTPTSSSSPLTENRFRSLLNYGDVHHRIRIPKHFHKNSSNNIFTVRDRISDNQLLSNSSPPNQINGNITFKLSNLKTSFH
jgi:hypothetical protein